MIGRVIGIWLAIVVPLCFAVGWLWSLVIHDQGLLIMACFVTGIPIGCVAMCYAITKVDI